MFQESGPGHLASDGPSVEVEWRVQQCIEASIKVNGMPCVCFIRKAMM